MHEKIREIWGKCGKREVLRIFSPEGGWGSRLTKSKYQNSGNYNFQLLGPKGRPHVRKVLFKWKSAK